MYAALTSLFLAHQAAMAISPPGIAPSVIYGDDDRIEYYQLTDDLKAQADSTVALVRTASLEILPDVTNFKTTSYGQSMGLCTSEAFFAQETLAFCSGSLIAPDIVVSAGHCVRTQAACDQTKFVFGFKLSDAANLPRQVPSDMVFSCKVLIHSVADPAGEDFSLIRLDRAVTHVKPLAYRTEGTITVGEGLRVMGHPAGLPLKIAGGATVRAVKEQFLMANLDTYGGNSGSSVFNAVDGKIEGILVRGEMDYIYKNGCRVSNVCAPDACRGEDVTLFERIIPVLNKALNP